MKKKLAEMLHFKRFLPESLKAKIVSASDMQKIYVETETIGFNSL